MINFIFILLAIFFTGYNFIYLLNYKPSNTIKISITFILGCSLWNLFLVLLNYNGNSLYNVINIILFVLFINILLGIFLFIKKREYKFKSIENFISIKNFIFFASILIFSLIGYFSYKMGAIGFDSRAFWIFKAKIIHYYGTWKNNDFLCLYRCHFHSNYPLFCSYISFLFNIFNYNFNDKFIKIAYLFITFLTFSFLFFNGKEKNNSIIASILFISTPIIILCSWQLHNDILLGLFVFFIFYELIFNELNIKTIVILSILTSTLPQIKNEGWLLSVLIIFILFIKQFIKLKNIKKNIFYIFIFISIFLVLTFFWLHIKNSIPNQLDESYIKHLNFKTLLLNTTRIYRIPILILKEFLNIRLFGFFWILLFFLLLKKTFCFIIKNKFILFGLIFSILYIISLHLIYYISPTEPEIHISSSFPRLLLHIFPICCLIIEELLRSE